MVFCAIFKTIVVFRGGQFFIGEGSRRTRREQLIFCKNTYNLSKKKTRFERTLHVRDWNTTAQLICIVHDEVLITDSMQYTATSKCTSSASM